MKIILGLLPLVFFASCTKLGIFSPTRPAKSPEEVVKSFIELSASAKEFTDKKKLEELCAGELRRALERMTDEAFKISYIANQIKIKEIKILESTTQNDTAKIRYQIAVENQSGTEPTDEINEREVELTRSQGHWYIASIRIKGTDKIAFTRGMIF